MKYFIFRNYTIENLFSSFETTFSGYGEITTVDDQADAYIWFYMLPLKADPDTIIAELHDFYQKLELTVPRIAEHKRIIILTIEKLFYYQWQNSDHRLNNEIAIFNHNLSLLAEAHHNIKIVDFSDFVTNNSDKALIDWKFYYTSQMVINPMLGSRFQSWFKQKIKAIDSQRKKCLILDLDNTLWGGILGEDGIDGIKLGDNYPGLAFSDFQENILHASKNGVILAVCSKNNEEDVLEAWQKNPFMILKKEHIAAYRINWQDKASNIEALASELNIGLESMVFIDDNPAERNLIRHALPEVTVPEFPEQPYALPQFFKKVYSENFQIYALTDEDREKTAQYKTNASRVRHREKFASIEAYFANLQMVLTILPADNFNIPRIAQITQKTNQFNLTTQRYSENDIHHFVNEGHMVLCMSVQDKFGDNGITAVAIVEIDKNEKTANIDSFMMSCRVLGRGVETAFLSIILNQLMEQQIESVKTTYIATAKNRQTENFYDQFGFSLIEQSSARKHYQSQLAQAYKVSEHFKVRRANNE
ncbi:MAG: HAD-IIIC family phosphatase [Gammaproteobacteria bacterium]|nr:HAD-IIIC family phosphatase [Gammaproteobacteria bacterium]